MFEIELARHFSKVMNGSARQRAAKAKGRGEGTAGKSKPSTAVATRLYTFALLCARLFTSLCPSPPEPAHQLTKAALYKAADWSAWIISVTQLR